MRNKIFILISLLLIAGVLTACGGVAAAQGITPTPETTSGDKVNRTITVNGSGKVSITPDIAYISIGVHTEGADANEAVASNNTQAQKVIDALKRMGIDAKDIKTINFSIYPQQEYDSTGKPTGEVKYSVDNTVYVTVRNLGQLGDILDQVVQAGANSVSGIQFDVADKSVAAADAREAAFLDARKQAEDLAQAAGVTLGEVQSISSFSSYPVPIYQQKERLAMDTASSVPVSPGEMEVSVDLTVVFTIQ